IRAGAERVAIFEIGRTFIPPKGKEERHLGVLLSGNVASAPDWRSQTNRRLDLFDLRGALDVVVPKLSFRPANFSDLALSIDIYSGDRMIGFGGKLLSAKSNAPGPVFVDGLHTDHLLNTEEMTTKFFVISKFTNGNHDVSMIA